MIPIGAYIRHRQPDEYAQLGERYPLPDLPQWVGQVEVLSVKVTQQDPEDFTPFQRLVDRVMRWRPRPGIGGGV